MKEKITSFEHFEQRLKQESLRIDEMPKEFGQQKKRNVFQNKLKLAPSFIVFIVALFITGTVVVAVEMSGLRFFNNNDKQVLVMTEMSEEEAAPHYEFDEINQKYLLITNRARRTLSQDEVAYLLDVEAYEKRGHLSMLTITRNDEINKYIELPINYFDTLSIVNPIQDRYYFSKARIFYEYPFESDEIRKEQAEEMYHEALQTNSPYTIRKRKISPSGIYSIYLEYELWGKEYFGITVQTMEEKISKISTTQDLSSYVKVYNNEKEYFYSELNGEILFVYEGTNKNFLVTINKYVHPARDVEVEELLQFANALLP